jgi:hypothetical protein
MHELFNLLFSLKETTWLLIHTLNMFQMYIDFAQIFEGICEYVSTQLSKNKVLLHAK